MSVIENKLGGMTLGSSVKANASIAEKFFNGYIANVTSKVNELVHILYPFDATGKGGVSTSGSDPRYTLGINFILENGISPMSSGIDGTSIYTFASNSLVSGTPKYKTVNPVFWKSDPEASSNSRPKTIYETFLSVMERFDSQILSLREEINTVSSGETISEYTKGFIGYRAFSPTGSSTPGSMTYNIEYLLAKLNEVKEDLYGTQHVLRSGLDSAGQSFYSVLQLIDALLLLHGGEDYVSGYSWTSPITLSHEGIIPLEGNFPKVEFLPASSAERLIENASLNSPTEIRFLRDDNSYELALNATTFNDLLDTQEYNSVVIPYLPGQALFRQESNTVRAWHSGTATPYLTTISRFTWSPGSELVRPERVGSEEDIVSELRDGGELTVKKFNPITEGLTISLVYEVIVEDGESDIRCLIGNTVDSHFRNIVEITGYATSSIDSAINSDPKRVSLTWKGTLEGNLDEPLAECSLRPGVNKVLLARRLQLSDFNINELGDRSVADIFIDNQCFVDVMSINVIHRAEKNIVDDLFKQVTLVGLEIIIEEV